MIRRKLGNTKMATTTIKPTDISTVGEIAIGDTTTPIVKAGGVEIITTTDLQNSPVITQSEVLTQQEMLPDSSRPTSEISNISDSATLTQDEQLQTTEPPKKPFPWWILLVGAGLIYMLARKK
jgi:hypothetical protein